VSGFLISVQIDTDVRSSNAMPREVREAIAWCIEQGGQYDEEGAKAYVDNMFDTGRGGEESW
jgi:sulfite reductase alpha subunit-like flavoprotein